MAWAVITPVLLMGAALATASFPTRHSALQNGLVMLLVSLALLTALRLHLINLRAICEPLERATRSVQSLAWGSPPPPLRLPYLNETAELLVATHELGDYLAVMRPGDGSASRQELGASLDEVVARLRQACDQIDQLNRIPAAATGAASTDDDTLEALRLQVARLIGKATALGSAPARTHTA